MNSKECFDPDSSICQGCILTDDPSETVMFHIAHLEQDHGIKITEKNGFLKMDNNEYLERGGHKLHGA